MDTKDKSYTSSSDLFSKLKFRDSFQDLSEDRWISKQVINSSTHELYNFKENIAKKQEVKEKKEKRTCKQIVNYLRRPKLNVRGRVLVWKKRC